MLLFIGVIFVLASDTGGQFKNFRHGKPRSIFVSHFHSLLSIGNLASFRMHDSKVCLLECHS